MRLPTFLREYDKVARQCAAEGADSRRFLLQLSELELLDREQRATERRIKAAKFPVTKTLDTFDFLALPALNKKLVLELALGEFIDRRENVLALGNSGTGKTRLGVGTGGLPGRLSGSLHHRRGAGQRAGGRAETRTPDLLRVKQALLLLYKPLTY